MHMLICIVIFIAPCNLTFRPMPASAYMYHLDVLRSPDACLLAWHLSPVVMKMMSVQVCSESTGHAGLFKRPMTLSRIEFGKLVNLL